MTEYRIEVSILKDGPAEVIADMTIRSDSIAASALRAIADEIDPPKTKVRGGLGDVFTDVAANIGKAAR